MNVDTGAPGPSSSSSSNSTMDLDSSTSHASSFSSSNTVKKAKKAVRLAAPRTSNTAASSSSSASNFPAIAAVSSSSNPTPATSSAPRNNGVGPSTQPAARRSAAVRARSSLPPQVLDKNTSSMLFNFANKYRPETRAEKKKRRRAKKLGVKGVTGITGAGKKDKKGKAKAVEIEGDEAAAESKPYFLRHGMDHAVALVEARKARLVVISDDVEPSEVLVWLPALCYKMEVPYAIVRGSARLGTLVNKKSTTAITFTEVREEDEIGMERLSGAVRAFYANRHQSSRRAWSGGLIGFRGRVRMARQAIANRQSNAAQNPSLPPQ
ncbi:60S ribosomal protein L8B [Mortierella sp. GBA35]|nr:60S ribosomal protein L8B [Mortierella sp. GBA35]